MRLRLDLPNSMFEELLKRYRKRFPRPDEYLDNIVADKDAVPIFTGFGPAAFLTRTGRVFMDPNRYYEGPALEATEEEVHTYLNFGAKTLGFPELLEILPPQPDDAILCDRCVGDKWLDPEGKKWCPRCVARGWVWAPRVER